MIEAILEVNDCVLATDCVGFSIRSTVGVPQSAVFISLISVTL